MVGGRPYLRGSRQPGKRKGKSIVATVMTEWESTKPNPDEEHLRALWQEEIKSLVHNQATLSVADRCGSC